MRIKSLWIEKYKNLEDFKIEFDISNSLNIIIGKNGSGKSNFLEALTEILNFIYYYLDYNNTDENNIVEKTKLEKEFKFKLKEMFLFEMEIIEKNEIFSYSLKGKKDNYHFVFDKVNRTKEEEKSLLNNPLLKENPLKKLPKNIYLYDSGQNSRLLKYFKELEKKEYKKIRSNENIRDISRMINFNSSFGIFFILLSYIYDNNFLINNFNEYIGIKEIKEFKIKFITPPWYKNINLKRKKMPFWGLENIVALEIIDEYFETISTKNENGDTITIKSAAINDLKKLKDIKNKLEDEYISKKYLLESFYTLFLLKLVKDIELIFIDKEGNEINYEYLSEGQKQLINVLGITDINSDINTLFLLDEPDTFLHPKWQRDLAGLIEKFEFEGQIFMTTHSPLTLGKVNKENIHIFKNGKAFSPSADTLNRDVAEILEEIMEVNSRPNEISELIEEFDKNIAMKDIENAKNKLEELRKNLTHSDPFLVRANSMLRRLEILNEAHNKK